MDRGTLRAAIQLPRPQAAGAKSDSPPARLASETIVDRMPERLNLNDTH
jgi:hypothetical protein